MSVPRILMIMVDFPTWGLARPWGYPANFALEEGLRGNGVEPVVIPVLSGIPSSSRKSWLRYAEQLCRPQSFDQVWVWLVHSVLDEHILAWIQSIAPIRVGLIPESLDHTSEELKLSLQFRDRKVLTLQQAKIFTHILACDEKDVAYINSENSGNAVWWTTMIPERFLIQSPTPPKNNRAVFYGSLYSQQRVALVTNKSLQQVMSNPRAPEDVTEWPGAFDALHERVSRSLECKGFGTWNELSNYVDSLKNIRTQIFQLWLEELTHWGAIVNFPTVVKCYTSRVVESMSAGSPCIACEIPDRPRNRALFTENKEILFFDPHSPESLLAQIKKIQRDPEFGQFIARNALEKVRQFHTAEVRIQQILQWIQTGQEPRYSEQESEGVVGKGERGEPMSEHMSLNNNHRNQEFGEPMMKSQNTIDENPHNPILEIASPEGKEALVSVIIPTLDRPEFLRKAVKSILNQTYRQFEIIVINDGGTDVGEILSNIDVGERLTYVRLPQNRERSHARNVGITLAKGKYIAYLDDDDQFLPDHLETLVTFLETSNYEIAYTDAYRIVHEKKNGRYLETHRDVPYSYEFSREKLLRENFIPILSIMHLRSCFDRTGFFDESLNTHED